MILAANESARINVGEDRVAAVVRERGQASTFVREMPGAVPIGLFNTGIGLKYGDPDPHWEVVSRSDDPTFKPQPAIVVSRDAAYYAKQVYPGKPQNPYESKEALARSQWVSPIGDVDLPEGVVYVYRTRFDLTGMLLSRTMLKGRCLADDHVVAVRLNGRSLKLPPQHVGRAVHLLDWFLCHLGICERRQRAGDRRVERRSPQASRGGPHREVSNRRLRVELEGTASRDPGLPGKGASGNTLHAPSRPSAQVGSVRGSIESHAGGSESRPGGVANAAAGSTTLAADSIVRRSNRAATTAGKEAPIEQQ